MVTIKASCPTCSDCELVATDILLMVCANAPLSYYSFFCPTCADEVRKPANDHVIALLLSGGVVDSYWRVPDEALEPHSGPALTYDDLLDFALALKAEDFLAPRADTSAA